MDQSRRLWDKGGALDDVVHRFTVGDDPWWDRHLVHWDCLGSAAHAHTLARAGLLSADETASLLAGLAEIDALAAAGRFEIPPDLEDSHTAVEAALTRRSAAGAKIHTGRSRNDQVATAMRLFLRHHALDWLERLDAFAAAVLARAAVDGDVPMPGYTHLQPAMPSTFSQWLHAVAEALLEQARAAIDLLDRIDTCPLGTGAGFGVPLPLDRTYTAARLGFSSVQRSPIDVQNSRGRMEKYFVRVGADIAGVLDRMCCDLLIFSTAEFGFVSLPEPMTTGSSIMPQKRNPDVLELMRAHAARLRGRLMELESITGKLPSGYQRDLQLTKEPAIRTACEVADLLAVGTRIVAAVRLDRERLATAMRPELYATNAALARAAAGVPFREAYRQVAAELAAGTFQPDVAPSAPQAGRVSPEAWTALRDDWDRVIRRKIDIRARVDAAERELLPRA